MGYAGGTKLNPTYRDLGDHAEALQVDYDPRAVSYRELLTVFWSSHRPTHPDRASQYRSAILAADPTQLDVARHSHAEAQASLGRALYTQIELLAGFTLAEDYHQKYRLGRVPGVREELRASYPDIEAYTNSTAVMRINAYLGGHLPARALADEIETFGLSKTAQRELIQAVS